MRSILTLFVRRPSRDPRKVLVRSQIEAMPKKAIPQGFIKDALAKVLRGSNNKAILCVGITLAAFWSVPSARAVQCTEARTFPFTWTLSKTPANFTLFNSNILGQDETFKNILFPNNSYTISYIFNPDPGACLTSPLPAAVNFNLRAYLSSDFVVGLPVPEGIGVVSAASSLLPGAPVFALASGITTYLVTDIGPVPNSKGVGTYGYTVNLNSRVSTSPPRNDLPPGTITVDADLVFVFSLVNPNLAVTFLYPKEDPQDVPAPIPLTGVAAAFSFSRKLHKRIKTSKTPEVICIIG
jgi:hypothetical protein